MKHATTSPGIALQPLEEGEALLNVVRDDADVLLLRKEILLQILIVSQSSDLDEGDQIPIASRDGGDGAAAKAASRWGRAAGARRAAGADREGRAAGADRAAADWRAQFVAADWRAERQRYFDGD